MDFVTKSIAIFDEMLVNISIKGQQMSKQHTGVIKAVVNVSYQNMETKQHGKIETIGDSSLLTPRSMLKYTPQSG